MRVKRCRLGRSGQSILEYLVVATVVVLAIIGIRAGLTEKFKFFADESIENIGEAGTKLDGLEFGRK